MSNSNRRRLLLLNPPGKQVYLRDYYCSKVTQADYVNHPVDLVMLSGRLREHFDLHLIDAIVDRLPPPRCLEQIDDLDPDIIVGLTGSVSFPEDADFYRTLQQTRRRKLYLGGDLVIENRVDRLGSLPFVDGFVHDFISDDLPALLTGIAPDALHNLTVRLGDGSILARPIERSRGDRFELPVPDHRLFLDKPYRYPFVGDSFATVLTLFGCPYRCDFCVMAGLGWKSRSIPNVIEELSELARLNVRELFFLDQTFGVPRPRYVELLHAMTNSGFRFGWVCFSRADILDPALLGLMKSAGCHTLILGLESGSQRILDAARKDMTLEDIGRGFQLCREIGLKTVATVLIGLPEETESTFRDTLAFLKQIDPDFASFNVAVPRMGTGLREKAMQLGLISEELEIMDQSGSFVAMPSQVLSRAEIARMRRRAVREFYFRPRYVARRLKPSTTPSIRWWREVKHQARQGLAVARKYWN